MNDCQMDLEVWACGTVTRGDEANPADFIGLLKVVVAVVRWNAGVSPHPSLLTRLTHVVRLAGEG